MICEVTTEELILFIDQINKKNIKPQNVNVKYLLNK